MHRPGDSLQEGSTMTSHFHSATLPTFEDTRPAPYLAAEGSAIARYWSTATLPPAQPLPQDSWLIELPEVDPPPAPTRLQREGRVPLALRIAGLAAATLLTLFALGLAASLLDAPGARGVGAREQLAIRVL
jgi:hypothetical protein